MLKPLLLAGLLLLFMSMTDTLAYAVRTAGVMTGRLAISLSLFNGIVVFSRMANMLQAPILGNYADAVNLGRYTSEQVLVALRWDLLFVLAGVVIGALLTRSYMNTVKRGIALLESKGSLPRTAWHGLTRIWRLPYYMLAPQPAGLVPYLKTSGLPVASIVCNVFVTCFYSIGVMSTVLAASWDHDLASTANQLSGIVNGIATVLFFVIVDPPAAVVIDQCINGKRPKSDAKALHLWLVITRFAGVSLGILLLPYMARYVQFAAEFFHRQLN
jgi:hypothetical protein